MPQAYFPLGSLAASFIDRGRPCGFHASAATPGPARRRRGKAARAPQRPFRPEGRPRFPPARPPAFHPVEEHGDAVIAAGLGIASCTRTEEHGAFRSRAVSPCERRAEFGNDRAVHGWEPRERGPTPVKRRCAPVECKLVAGRPSK